MASERKREIRRRRQRQEKLRTLRARLAQASTEQERRRISEKIRKISPWALIGPEKTAE